MNALALVLVLSTTQVDLPMPPPPTPKASSSTKAKPKPKPAEEKPATTSTPSPSSASTDTSSTKAATDTAQSTRAQPAASVQQSRRIPPLDIGVTIGPAMVLNSQASGVPPYFRLGGRADLRLLQHDKIGISAGIGVGLAGAVGSYSILGQTIPFSATMFDFYPSGRATLSVAKDVGLYAELGLVLGYAASTVQQQFVGNVSAGAGGAGLRLALGAEWRLSPSMALLIEPMALNVFSSSYSVNGTTVNQSATLWGLYVGGSFRL